MERTVRRSKITAAALAIAIAMQFVACAVQRHTLKDRLRSPFTILGFGDSITEGGPDFFSYLFPLDSMLHRAGYPVRFIGPRVSKANGDSLFHAGYSGRNAEYLAARVDSIYSLYPADLVLLHTGHNHFVEEAPVPGIIAAQRKILQTIKTKNPSAVVLVAAVITAGKLPKYEYIPQLNTAIKAMVDSLHDPSVVFVDQSAGWNWQQQTISDKVHPNRDGANRIAGRWFEAIEHLSKK